MPIINFVNILSKTIISIIVNFSRTTSSNVDFIFKQRYNFNVLKIEKIDFSYCQLDASIKFKRECFKFVMKPINLINIYFT